MRIKTVRGSNQYRSKGEIIGAASCKKCGRFIDYVEYTLNPFPMRNPKPEYHKECQP